MKAIEINRRQFLRRTTGAAVGAASFPYVVSSSALGKAGSVAASNRITVGCVGVGPRGTAVMRNFLAEKD
ncbi:MAG: twin-arginine translocation signal domain-containing protein, partial [Planctomycetota bacterium]